MENNIAIFVDAENLTSWANNNGIAALVNDLQSQGQVVVRRAYGKWSSPQLCHFQSEFNLNGFELVQTYHPVSGKNSADIKMVVDVMELISRSNLQKIVLATGDSDFSPLFCKLREMGKNIIGVGPRSRLSECVQNSCSRYIYTETSFPAGKMLALPPSEDLSHEKVNAFATLHKILEAQDEPILLTKLKPLMLREDRAFDHMKLGYGSFKDFLLASGEVHLSPMIAGPVYASLAS